MDLKIDVISTKETSEQTVREIVFTKKNSLDVIVTFNQKRENKNKQNRELILFLEKLLTVA